MFNEQLHLMSNYFAKSKYYYNIYYYADFYELNEVIKFNTSN